jgi:hypothetical protein
LVARRKTLIAQYASSNSNITPMTGPRGQIAAGASVLPNRHIPTPNEIATPTPATASIHIFVEDRTPGTMSMEAMKRRKRSVETTAEIQYVQERIRLVRASLISSDSIFICI